MRGETLWHVLIVERKNLRKSYPVSPLQRDPNHLLPVALREALQDLLEVNSC